jgi:hypothetical protein
MTSAMLPVIQENAGYEIEQCLPFVVRQQGGSKLVYRLCRAYRRRGISALFLNGDAGELHRNLQRAGTAFAAMLERDSVIAAAASYAEPFFDAVAAHDFPTAERIAQRLSPAFTPGEEYEEDYYFLAILAAFLISPSDHTVSAQLLESFREFAASSGDLRFDVASGLVARDAAAFAAAMDRWLDQREAQWNKATASDNVIEDDWATEGQFFVEGLAVVRIAALLGIATEPDYLFIPSIAIETVADNLSPYSWRQP